MEFIDKAGARVFGTDEEFRQADARQRARAERIAAWLDNYGLERAAPWIFVVVGVLLLLTSASWFVAFVAAVVVATGVWLLRRGAR